jgi:hypothetical protein
MRNRSELHPMRKLRSARTINTNLNAAVHSGKVNSHFVNGSGWNINQKEHTAVTKSARVYWRLVQKPLRKGLPMLYATEDVMY